MWTKPKELNVLGVQIQIDQFDEGGITSRQDFMNTAAIKYLKVK